MEKEAHSWKRLDLRILLIEDDNIYAGLVKEILSEKCYFNSVEIAMSETLTEGLRRLDENEYDLVLLDLNLPDSAGVDTVENVSGYLDKVPFIVLTGNNDYGLEKKMMEKGVQDVVIKGRYDSDHLFRIIMHSIERYKFLKKIRQA